MSKKLAFHSILVLLLCLGIPLWVLAGTTGKIAGVVKEAETGTVLPGANVVIEGTTMGAAADVNGNYFILNVPPGIYRVRTTMMGYGTVSVSNVVVRIDRTTVVDFELKPVVLEAAEEVTVVAERELVRKDIAFTQTNLDAVTLESIPASYTLDQALTSQVGVGYDAQGLTIRRGTNQEISYIVDGMVLKDERTQRPYSGVSKTAIADVQLLTGAFSAEYGDARSGVVNVVTKQPGSKYTFSFDGRMSPLIGGDDSDFPGLKHFGPYIYSNDNWYEYGRFDWNGGAAAADKNKDGTPDFEGWTAWAANNTFEDQTLTPEQAFAVWAWEHRSENKDGECLYNGVPFSEYKVGNVTLADLIKPLDDRYAGLKANKGSHPLNWYAYEPDWNFDMTFTGPVPFTGDKLGFLLSWRNEYTLFPFYSGQPVYKDRSAQLKLIANFNPDMKLMATAMYSDIRQAHRGDFEGSLGAARPTYESLAGVWGSNNRIYEHDSETIPRGTFYDFFALTWTHTLSPKTFYEVKAQQTFIHYNAAPWARERDISPTVQIGPVQLAEQPRNWRYTGGRMTDMLGLYSLGGRREMDMSNTRIFRLSGDITSQITVNHQLKAGFEYIYNHVQELRGYTENHLYYTKEEYRLGPDGQLGTADDGATGDQANWHEYTIFPAWGGLYAQDRMEYGGMILTAGLRLDFYQPQRDFFDRNDIFMPAGAEYWDKHMKHWDDQSETNYYGLEPDCHPDLQLRLSPRLGVAHPIGPESKIYFNYGHFYQLPNFRYAYQFQLGWDEPLEDYPNAWLRMPKTVNYEVGFEQRLYGDFLINVRGYYKDVTDDIRDDNLSARGAGNPSFATNTVARDIKGLELEVAKRYGQFVTGFLNVDYNAERRSEYGWDYYRHPEHPNIIRDPYNTDDLRIVHDYTDATRQYRGTWKVKLNLALHTPTDFGPGPMILGAKPLGFWHAQLYHIWDQGDWYSWNPDGLANLVNVDNHQYKDYNWTNFHIEKRFTFAGVTAGLYADIENLFNVKNIAPDNRYYNGFASRKDNSLGGQTGPNAKEYAEHIFKSGKRLGDEPDAQYEQLIQRPYLFWERPRDFWFGLRLYF